MLLLFGEQRHSEDIIQSFFGLAVLRHQWGEKKKSKRLKAHLLQHSRSGHGGFTIKNAAGWQRIHGT